jgi:hypothetical protein
MTRAEKRLVMTWAKYRRRFGGGEPERSIKSRFLGEVPSNLVINLGVDEDEADVPQVDLTAERWSVRESARKNLYTGKTYNSVENVQQFFKERGVTTPLRPTTPPPRATAAPTEDDTPPWETSSAPKVRPAAPHKTHTGGAFRDSRAVRAAVLIASPGGSAGPRAADDAAGKIAHRTAKNSARPKTSGTNRYSSRTP